jgi:isopenicillin-N N-acyltransferase like protein
MPKPLNLRLQTSLPAERRVQLRGSRRELGLQHGRQLQGAIDRFLHDRRARVEALLTDPGAHATLSERCGEHARLIERHLPDMAEEIHGLAEGAGIDVSDAYLLQLRRELVGFSAMPRAAAAGGDCTTFGRCRGAVAVIGQTVDLNGDMAREATALDITHADGPRLLMLSFTGLLGYLGLNDRGLAIGLNLVLAGRWQTGIPEYMVIRHLLDTCATVDEAIERMRSLPLASSRALTLCDGRRLVTVEHVLNEFELFEGEELVHANHFLHPRFQPVDELNPFARGSSLRRQDACAAALRALPFDAAPAQYLRMLDEPPIDVPPKADIRRECTVASALMRIAEGELFIHPRSGATAPH